MDQGDWFATLAMIAVGSSRADDGERREGHNDRGYIYAVGLWGDLPYSAAQEVGVAALIDDMNAQRLAFTVHDGDLKAGSSECTDAVYTKALDYFNALKAPAMFTPGDNDWTDCDRLANYNSLAQLDKERALSSARRCRWDSASCARRYRRRRCA